MNNLHYDGPIVLAILDGVGLRNDEYGNAVLQSHSEFIDQLFDKYPWVSLEASGEAVGILKGQMGNSEVGHNALGAGQIIKQGIAKIEDDFNTGAIWQTEASIMLNNIIPRFTFLVFFLMVVFIAQFTNSLKCWSEPKKRES